MQQCWHEAQCGFCSEYMWSFCAAKRIATPGTQILNLSVQKASNAGKREMNFYEIATKTKSGIFEQKNYST